MNFRRRAGTARVLLLLTFVLLLNCNTWVPYQDPGRSTMPPELVEAQTVEPQPPPATAAPGVETPIPAAPTSPPLQSAGTVNPLTAGAGEPAGCLAPGEQAAFSSPRDMLRRAEQLLTFSDSLSERLLAGSWNPYTNQYVFDQSMVLTLTVDEIDNQFLVQRMLNALHVSGFVAYLRRTSDQGLHILAIPLLDPALAQSDWGPYLQAYWLSRAALPSGDPSVQPSLKLPPCGWMVERGFAPQVDASWYAGDLVGWPDYTRAAIAYLAPTNNEAARVAEQINWLGDSFPEGPDTMCGPLAWSIMYDSRVFPPGWGGWMVGSKVFWLAKPEKNGRPWSLFPKDSYRTYVFRQALGTFDFSGFPLYPGDFLYTYSEKDGFDHMLVVTEVDGAGNVYTVSNIVKIEPVKNTTIEHVLLLNNNDPTVGIARNEWARDGVNGRTGHAGFEVFRWAWVEKDVTGEPVSYTVRPGDTVGTIAAYWKTPALRIAGYNGIMTDTPLVIGQELIIPPNTFAGG